MFVIVVIVDVVVVVVVVVVVMVVIVVVVRQKFIPSTGPLREVLRFRPRRHCQCSCHRCVGHHGHRRCRHHQC